MYEYGQVRDDADTDEDRSASESVNGENAPLILERELWLLGKKTEQGRRAAEDLWCSIRCVQEKLERVQELLDLCLGKGTGEL